MSVVTNIGLAVAGLATAAGIIIGPELVATAPIEVACAEMTVEFRPDNTVQMRLVGCIAGDRPVVVSIPESPPLEET